MNYGVKSTFALFFGNRGFFPASLQASARAEITQALKKLGHKTLALEPTATRNGAVETPEEGAIYAQFLRRNAGKFDGVILCLPNFGDETGAVAALRDAGVPILIQAYPDELDKLDPARRRDAFCGKLSIMDVFRQYGVQFTALKPHVVHPTAPGFAANIDHFDRVCRVVKAMRRMTVAAIGARTTPFKTVRIDELALQRHGITMETLDLADVIARARAIKASGQRAKAKAARLREYSTWTGVPRAAFENITALGVVLDEIVTELKLDAFAIRCWLELQKELGISCCVLLSEMNERGIPASCEVDVGSAIAMHALSAASGQPSACLDWNNNYGDDDDKCILFHCGPVPQSLMAGKGCVTDHAILENAVGKGCGYGCNTGRLAPMPFTFGNLMTAEGKLRFYLGEGRITDDVVPKESFGCAGVAEIMDLQEVLLDIGRDGHRHHVAIAPQHVCAPMLEAFTDYLGYEVLDV
jgi:L-fucose isomerase-like protein